jgi:cytochrome oxidase Cu insertion factor (SCO1/SenC/PrrC family)
MWRSSRCTRGVSGALVLGLLAAGSLGAADGAARSYARTLARYPVPEVTLVDRGGRPVALPGLLAHDGPVVLQFVFTTCPAACPLLTAQLAGLPARLGEAGKRLLRVSISIDPDHDRPERLDAWARRFGAGPADSGSDERSWRVLTGEPAAVRAVRRAFDAASSDKSEHRPLTFVRGAPDGPWLRLEGFPTTAELAAEVRSAAPAPDPGSGAAARGLEPGAGRGAYRELGRRIYEQGVLPSGEPLEAVVLGGAVLSGAEAACARCHRSSGFGDSEGGLYVPPITGPVLASPRSLATVSRGELLRPLYQEVHTAAARARVRDLAPRPAYDPASLAAALRHGRDPGGDTLDPAMPRYRLEDGDVAHLLRYLSMLGATADPGVEPETLHLATVVTPGADPAARRAVAAVIEAYVRHKNADTRGFLARPGHSPWHRDDLAGSLRAWQVDVWELSGPPEAWEEQLRERYRRQPVFALVGGLAGMAETEVESWQPVHAFCESEAVPCLFPSTALPGTAPAARWTVYLSAGLAGEAEALARYLADRAGGGTGGGRVVQVYRDRAAGRVPARALRAALAGRGGIELEDRLLPATGPAGELDLGPGGATPSGGELPALVLWLGAADLASLGPAALEALAAAPRVYLSAHLAGDAAEPLAAALGDRLRLTWPFALPGEPAPHGFRVRAWLRSRGVALTHERLQLATHFALAVTDHALGHLVTGFSREYFLERVEHEAERSLDPGLYPHLSLGPGQRVAAKGCYVVRLDPEAPGGVQPDGGWIVP